MTTPRGIHCTICAHLIPSPANEYGPTDTPVCLACWLAHALAPDDTPGLRALLAAEEEAETTGRSADGVPLGLLGLSL